MKKILLISISSLILCCNPKKDNPYIYPNESMTQLLDSFIQETPNKNRTTKDSEHTQKPNTEKKKTTKQTA